ncbi:MAG TPA: hypothetical protein PK022_06050 [Syntrophales bacterium]|nr:hypothetical protein [Syntrophales bacterium]
MLAEKLKIVPVMNSANVSTGADCDSINMSGFHKATFIFTFGAVTTDITITPKSGASAGTKTTAVPSVYAAGGAAIGTAVAASTASCDVLAAWTATSTTVTLSAASNKFLVVEFDAAAMTDGEEWLTLTVAADSAGICHCVAILEPRYSSNRSATCLA